MDAATRSRESMGGSSQRCWQHRKQTKGRAARFSAAARAGIAELVRACRVAECVGGEVGHRAARMSMLTMNRLAILRPWPTGHGSYDRMAASVLLCVTSIVKHNKVQGTTNQRETHNTVSRA